MYDNLVQGTWQIYSSLFENSFCCLRTLVGDKDKKTHSKLAKLRSKATLKKVLKIRHELYFV